MLAPIIFDQDREHKDQRKHSPFHRVLDDEPDGGQTEASETHHQQNAVESPYPDSLPSGREVLCPVHFGASETPLGEPRKERDPGDQEPGNL